MKKYSLLLTAFAGSLFFAACNDNESRYYNLSTGEAVELEKDEKTGLMVDAETGKTVRVYVDRESKDTIWGATGKVVNGQIVKADDGEWKITNDDDSKVKMEDGDYKVKDGDYKKKVEKDGDVKIKDGDKTIKIDGETGERKVSNDD